MKYITIVGARPQFIKAAALSRALRKEHQEILVHTGQHYDKNMSDVFFDELQIPKPNYHLNVGSGSHGKQTGLMLSGIEEIILKEQPDGVIVYGDTNSTIAGALAASKLLIPVIHVEAGLRSYNKAMPEEQNRILTDHISSILICPTETAVQNLEKEGITKSVYNTGDIMFDTILFYKELANEQIDIKELMSNCDVEPGEYYLSTLHRAENTDNDTKIREILEAFECLDKKVVLPLHPRTRAIVQRIDKTYNNIKIVDPVSYFEMIKLLENSKKVITDSGGLQKEAFFMRKQCITLREQTEWVETLNDNWNTLCAINKDEILEKVKREPDTDEQVNYFGDGKSAETMVRILEKMV